ncbi:MAG: cytidylate kinase-like family protein [Prevotella sp.]|jgi:cytidylate kinase|nr:cytidylate kinase-like family protein [Prevotella sp.]
MNLNEKFVITINRELGSGGRTVGKKLAEKLGVPFYDKALIKALQEKYHLTVEEIEKLKGRNHGWWAEFKRMLSIGVQQSETKYYQVAIGEEPDLLTTDEIFLAEQEILKGMAAEESCIIAGRSGFYVLRNHPNRLSILIQASMDFRVSRVARKQGITPDEARKTIEKVDKMRENYINKYTKTSRYDTHNYDLVISADGKTEDEIVKLILSYIGQN